MLDRLLRISVTGLFAFAIAAHGHALAAADDDDDDDDDEWEDPCGGDPCGGDPDRPDDAPSRALDDEARASRTTQLDNRTVPSVTAEVLAAPWPIPVFARPGVLPVNAWEAGLDVGIFRVFDETSISIANLDLVDLRRGGLNFTYGVIDKLQVGGSFAFGLSPFELEGTLSIFGHYLAVDDGDLMLRADASLAYDTGAQELGTSLLGALIRYRLEDVMVVLSRPALRINSGLDQTGETVTQLSFVLPVGLGYQANDNVAIELNVLLASLAISNTDSVYVAADALFTSLTGVYSVDETVDMGASLSADVLDSVDFFAFTVFMRYRGGL